MFSEDPPYDIEDWLDKDVAQNALHKVQQQSNGVPLGSPSHVARSSSRLIGRPVNMWLVGCLRRVLCGLLVVDLS